MKIVGYILAASFLLAVVRSIVVAAMAIGVIMLLWGAFFRTAQTFGLLGMLLLYGMAASQPLACIVLAGVFFVVIRQTRPTPADTGRPDPGERPRLPPP